MGDDHRPIEVGRYLHYLSLTDTCCNVFSLYVVVSRLGQMTRTKPSARGRAVGEALVPTSASDPHGEALVSTSASDPHGTIIPSSRDNQHSPLAGWREFDLRRAGAGGVKRVSAAINWDPTTVFDPVVMRRASDSRGKKDGEGQLAAPPSTSTASSSSRPSPKMRKAAVHSKKASQLRASSPEQSRQARLSDPQEEVQGPTGALSSDLAGSRERHIQCVLPMATDSASTQRDGSRTKTRLLQLFAPLLGDSRSDQRPRSEGILPLDRMNAILRWIQCDLGIFIEPINPWTHSGNSATSIAVSNASDHPILRTPFGQENLYHYRPEYDEKARYTPGYSTDQLGGFSVSTYLGQISEATSGYLGHIAGRVVDQQTRGRDAQGWPCSTGQGFLGDPWINGILLAEVTAALSRLGGSKHAVKQIVSYDRFNRQLERPRSVLRGVEVAVRNRAQAVHNIGLCLEHLQQIPGFPCIDYCAKDIVDGKVSLWQLLSTVYDNCELARSSKAPLQDRRRARAHSTAADEGGAKSAPSPRPSSAPPAVGHTPQPPATADPFTAADPPGYRYSGEGSTAAAADGSSAAVAAAGGSAVARVREAEMKEERRRARAIDRRHRLKLFNRAAAASETDGGGITGDSRAAVGITGDSRAAVGTTGDSRAAVGTIGDSRAAVGTTGDNSPPVGKVDVGNIGMDRRKWRRHYLWTPPKLSAVEVATAKTASYVPTISKSQQATVRQWLSSLHIHLVDGEGGFVLVSVQADAQAVKAMHSTPMIPLAEDRMRNGDLYAQLLCVLEPDLAIHAHIPRLLLGGGTGGFAATVELCMRNLERVFWLIRLCMCPPIPLVYLCQPREFLKGNRDLMWGLVWEMMQLYSTGSRGSSKPYSSTSHASLSQPASDLRIGQVEGGSGLQRLPYSSAARRQLDLSLLHWLDECGLLQEIGGDLCRPNTVLSLESYLRDGTLLCLLVERCFLSSAALTTPSSRVLHQWHWHRRPSTRHQCLLNLRSCLVVLRSCRHMSSRFLYAGMEESILGGRWDCILGLLEDMHRCADGLEGAPTVTTDDDREVTPYLGKFPLSPSVPDLRDRPSTSSLLHDVPGPRSFDRALHLDQFVVADHRRDEDATRLVEQGKAVEELPSIDPSSSSTDPHSIHGDAIRSSFDLFPSIAVATEKDPMDDDDAHSKYRDRQLTYLDPSLGYSGLALPSSPSDTRRYEQATNTMIQQQQGRQIEDQDEVNHIDDDDDDGADDDDAAVEEGGHHHPLRDTLSPDSLGLSPDSLGSIEKDSLQDDGGDAVQEVQPASEHQDSRVSSISLAILRFRQSKLLRWLQEEGVSSVSLQRPLPSGSLLPADTFSDGVLLCELVRRLERCGPLPGTHPRPTCSTHRIQNVRRCLELLAERNRRIPLRELSCEEEVLRGDMDRTLDLLFSIRKGYRGRGQGRNIIR